MRNMGVLFALLVCYLMVGDAVPLQAHNQYGLGYKDMPYMYLAYSTDTAGIMELQNLLLSKNYGREYEAGVFDCSVMSAICAKWLEDQGYEAMCFTNDVAHHSWVVARVGDGYVPVDVTIAPTQSMGYVLQNIDWLCGYAYRDGEVFETAIEMSARDLDIIEHGGIPRSATGWTA